MTMSTNEGTTRHDCYENQTVDIESDFDNRIDLADLIES